METVYLKMEKNVEVSCAEILVADVAKIYCSDSSIKDNINAIVVFNIRENGKGKRRFVISVMRVIKQIKEKMENVDIVSLGEADVVVEYMDSFDTPIVEYGKIVFVSIVCVVGSAFAIMAYNNDINSNDLFLRIYQMILGNKNGYHILEISYSVGLLLGILIFYGHIGKARITKDPTPLEIEMRMYERDLNDSIVQVAGREEKEIDVD